MTVAHMLRGTGWSLLLRWAVRGVGLINTIILARLLVPEDFGIVAMAMILIGLIDAILDLGVGLFLIRVPGLTREHCDNAWTINFVQGIVIALLVAALAPVAAAYFREPRVEPVLMVMAIVPLLRGLENIGICLLRRDNRFDLDFRFRVIARITLFCLTVGLALLLRDYWAIVYGRLVGTAFETALSYAFRPHWPRLSFSKSRELLSFSATIVTRGIGVFAANKIDVVLVGRLASTATLGVYNVASDLVAIVSSEVATSITRGAYPTYSRVAADRAAFAQAFLQSFGTTLVICLPMGFGLAASAPNFVEAVFGSKWMALVPVLQWLALFGTTYAITWVMGGTVLIAAGQERTSALAAWLQVAIRGPIVIAAGILWGVDGVVRGMVLGGLLCVPATAALLVRNIPVTVADLLHAAWRPVIAGLVMALVVRMLPSPDYVPAVVRLAMDVATGGVVYVLLIFGLWRLQGRPSGPEKALFELITARVDGRPSG